VVSTPSRVEIIPPPLFFWCKTLCEQAVGGRTGVGVRQTGISLAATSWLIPHLDIADYAVVGGGGGGEVLGI